MEVRCGFPFNFDAMKASIEFGLSCEHDKGLTQQEFRDESDINTIVRRFGLTGELPADQVRIPRVGDFSHVVDFKTALDSVIQAKDAFMQLPAELRARFQNDPQELMMFLEDEKNRDEAISLGLVNKSERARLAESIALESAARADVDAAALAARNAKMAADLSAAGKEFTPPA